MLFSRGGVQLLYSTKEKTKQTFFSFFIVRVTVKKTSTSTCKAFYATLKGGANKTELTAFLLFLCLLLIT